MLSADNSSTRISGYSVFSDCRMTPPGVMRSRFTVISPSRTAMTTDPSTGFWARFTISSSPSEMPAPFIEDPDTRTMKVLVTSWIKCSLRLIRPSK